MREELKFRRRPTLDISDREIMDMMHRCEDKETKAQDMLDVIESMLNMELDSAKRAMKSANKKGEARNFEYAYGQVSGLGTALCCFRKATDMGDELLRSQEILFFPQGRCGMIGSFGDELSSGFMSLGDVVWEIYTELIYHRIEPIPATVYDAFYERALDKGYPTELYLKTISEKPDKTPEDRKILRIAVSCEQIATQGERWHGKEIEERYKRRGIWR